MAGVSIHKGAYTSIGSDSSPGLLFLRSFLAAIDSFNPTDHAPIASLLRQDATLTINNGPAIPAEQMISMLGMRGTKLAKFGHDLHTAWDIAGGDGRRTVMYESTSFTVFKDDQEGVEARVNEFNIIELVKSDDGVLRALELRTYMDASPVSARAQAVMSKSGQTQ
ncbi:hypothetical protein DL771_004432 [Monosporascus sp. 5C6A]|nr:hypothetical protein DL771_004432 [Monosporascus sp. 5C6A]